MTLLPASSYIIMLLGLAAAAAAASGAPLVDGRLGYSYNEDAVAAAADATIDAVDATRPVGLPDGSASFAADQATAADGGPDFGIPPPPDPSMFKTPEDLKEYLERLQLYYTLVGLPRFGKRSSQHRSPASSSTSLDHSRSEGERGGGGGGSDTGERLRDRVEAVIVI